MLSEDSYRNGGAVAITDRMKHGVQPSPVRSESYLHNINAGNGSNFNCTIGQHIIFDVPALGNGYYCLFHFLYQSGCDTVH